MYEKKSVWDLFNIFKPMIFSLLSAHYTKPCQLSPFSWSWSFKETHNLFMAVGDCYWVPPVRLMGPRSSETKARHYLGIWAYWLLVSN